jgi:hypothetical protein
MNVYGFLGNLESGKVVNITLSHGYVTQYIARTSLSSYIFDNNNYYYLQFDKESKESALYTDIKNIIESRGDGPIYESLCENLSKFSPIRESLWWKLSKFSSIYDPLLDDLNKS